MCMTAKEMNETMAAIQEWKRIREEADDNITALNAKAMEFLNETPECEAFDKKGNPIRKFVGIVFRATLSRGERETVSREGVKELLSEEDYRKVSKISVYPVLRIS